jgi:hypothetical protein
VLLSLQLKRVKCHRLRKLIAPPLNRALEKKTRSRGLLGSE